MCRQAAKALASLCKYAGLSEPLLVAKAIIITISCAGSIIAVFLQYNMSNREHI